MVQEQSELAVIDAQVELVVRRPPNVVLEEARKAARALKDVIEAKPKRVMFNGEQYLEFEDWQTVARFYGITAKVVSVTHVSYGQVQGFSAHAVALRSDGQIISAAEAECLTDEDKWRSRAKYEYQDGKRVKVGDESVPLFQLKSMAQTRACAKVFRNVLAWVVVLAGYRPTPAEELPVDRVATDGTPTPSAQQQQAQTPAADGVTTIKDVQIKTGPGKDKTLDDGTIKKGKPWKRYGVTFADGRGGGTFDSTLGERCVAARAAGVKIVPVLDKTEKGYDLRDLKDPPVTVAPPVAHPADEPVTGPEKILAVRDVVTPNGPRWVIQTEKRQLATDKEDLAKAAKAAREGSAALLPHFDVMPTTHGPINRLLGWVSAPWAQPATGPTTGDLPGIGEL